MTKQEEVTPANEQRWRGEAMPIHGWRILDARGSEIVREIYNEEVAEQIVREHNAHKLLVALARQICNEGYLSPVEDAVDMACAALALVDGSQEMR